MFHAMSSVEVDLDGNHHYSGVTTVLSCAGATLHQTNGYRDEQPTLANDNMGGGIILRYTPMPEVFPPAPVEQCRTTLYNQRDCNEGALSYEGGYPSTMVLDGDHQQIDFLCTHMQKVRSILLKEQSAIQLYQDAQYGGEPFSVSNENTDGCVCVNFMKRDGSDYDIDSLIYNEVEA